MSDNRNDGSSNNHQIDIQPNIGLDSDVRQSIIKILNMILADEAVLTIKTRNAYWNTQGIVDIELHTLYETQYQLLNHISDEIAERIRILGGFAVGTLAEFLKLTRMVEQPGFIPDIILLLADNETVTRNLREDARNCKEEYEDEGTFKLLVNVLREHEKMAWMLRSLIEPKLSDIGKRGRFSSIPN
jgi:starvation-inducible DNA-binding protein